MFIKKKNQVPENSFFIDMIFVSLSFMYGNLQFHWLFKNLKVARTGELAQCLRGFAAFAADLGSIPHTHMMAHNHL